MELILSCVRCLTLMSTILLIAFGTFSGTYDPLDPTGNITVTFDIHDWTLDGCVARVTIQNYYQYRYVDKPGWQIGWTWTMNEVIWSMSGAFATAQGDCSSFKFQTPHSCKPVPIIADLMPDALPENRTGNCCKGGPLSARVIDPDKLFSSFEITVGNLESNGTVYAPANLTLWAPGPGCTCSPVLETDPTKHLVIGGRREIQKHGNRRALILVSCLINHPFVESHSPHSIIPRSQAAQNAAVGAEKQTNIVFNVQDYHSLQTDVTNSDIVQCTDHNCPIGVHWHIKNCYKTHWRVKLTISNYNLKRNYSNWNVLVQHPAFSQKSIVYSFNNSVLPTFGFTDEVALFWGLENYNTLLLQAGERLVGSVSTEMLLEKDSKKFTLGNGWALPRRIYFSGEECEMPPPDNFPQLPNACARLKPFHHYLFLLLLVYFSFKMLAT